MVVQAQKHDHVTPILKSLHWLPIKQRILYKVLTLTYHGLHGMAPAYITDFLQWYVPGRALRSTDELRLQVPRHNSDYGARRFGVAAPRLWNSLPMTLKSAESLLSFKRLLKTHLFIEAFGQ